MSGRANEVNWVAVLLSHPSSGFLSRQTSEGTPPHRDIVCGHRRGRYGDGTTSTDSCARGIGVIRWFHAFWRVKSLKKWGWIEVLWGHGNLYFSLFFGGWGVDCLNSVRHDGRLNLGGFSFLFFLSSHDVFLQYILQRGLNWFYSNYSIWVISDTLIFVCSRATPSP